jgi:CubicO group peptidase (beta-lactamase class C family)
VGGSDRVAELLGSSSLSVRVMNGPSDLFRYDEMWKRPEILAAEMPSSNGVADARSLARLYAAVIGLVDGVRLLAPATLSAACIPHSEGPDRVILVPSRFGAGFGLPPFLSPACGARAFGHAGAGGSLAFADPDAEIGFGYVMNEMRFEPHGDPRATSLVEAVYRSLR